MKNLLAATALSLLLAACGGGADAGDNSAAGAAANLTTKPSGNDVAMNTDVMMNGAVAQTPVTAPEFVNQAAASDQFEIKSSQLAATKSASPAIKAYAAMLIAEHTKSTNELTAAAAAGTPALTPSPTMTAEQQANLNALDKAPKGAAFDKLYAQLQVPSHQNTLALLQGYAVRGDQPMLKTFASKMVPVVQKHLTEAQGMAAQ
jgi:putative membrane protein